MAIADRSHEHIIAFSSLDAELLARELHELANANRFQLENQAHYQALKAYAGNSALRAVLNAQAQDAAGQAAYFAIVGKRAASGDDSARRPVGEVAIAYDQPLYGLPSPMPVALAKQLGRLSEVGGAVLGDQITCWIDKAFTPKQTLTWALREALVWHSWRATETGTDVVLRPWMLMPRSYAPHVDTYIRQAGFQRIGPGIYTTAQKPLSIPGEGYVYVARPTANAEWTGRTLRDLVN